RNDSKKIKNVTGHNIFLFPSLAPDENKFSPVGSLGNIMGIDEAGRGPLAGPVVVAGVKIALRSKNEKLRIWEGIRDSKQLSAKQREEWFVRLTSHPKITWATAIVSPGVIDRINIYRAAQRGARRVYQKLAPDCSAHALLDGSLHLPARISQETIIKGDEFIPLISAASIIAKVTRDRLMIKLHKKYPQYRFDLHKGYGTALHRKMLVHYGACPIHRASFNFKHQENSA
ncbi:MAG: ribonuclease HII, partial [Candidatus Sungbacteria bacterium]|nr:ribonuclease HII [Candidatus Sungbacteria bacterium]